MSKCKYIYMSKCKYIYKIMFKNRKYCEIQENA